MVASSLSALMWHAHLTADNTTFMGPNGQYDVNAVTTDDIDFKASNFIAQTGRTKTISNFSERLGILTFDLHDQYFDGEPGTHTPSFCVFV